MGVATGAGGITGTAGVLACGVQDTRVITNAMVAIRLNTIILPTLEIIEHLSADFSGMIYPGLFSVKDAFSPETPIDLHKASR